MTKLISISLIKRGKDNKKFELSTLDAYSLKKYKTFYTENKTQVNADIKALSAKHKTVVPKDITMLLFSEMLPLKEKNEFLEIHLKNITKFE